MSASKMSPDDPRLTAYALRELTGQEVAEVATAIERDPALAAEVAAIRALGGDLESALQAESLPATEPVELAERIEFPPGNRTAKRFPLYWVSGLVAAGFAVLVVVQRPESPLVGTPGTVAASPAKGESAPDIAGPEPVAPSAAPAVMSARNEADAVADAWVPFEASAAKPGAYASTAMPMDSGRTESRRERRSLSLSASMIRPEVLAGEGYASNAEHGWKQVAHAPLSTFGVDVDSASYANVRRFLQRGKLPPIDAVKIEELVNAFSYDYTAPAGDAAAPLQANLEVAAAPWAPEHRLVRIGLKAREMAVSARAPANLVFLLDVSGSMNAPRKLPLVKEAMRLLIDQLTDQDRVAIVTYAGQSGLALPSTSVAQRQTITAALAGLAPGGSTHGSNGIHLAYDVAKANFVIGGINRVILCTDGDFNVGTTGLGELERLIAAKAESGVYLTALGFGTGNYQDDTLELLANRGNGAHGYIDSVREARRLLVEQVNGTLTTVAQDVKIQVEFNPAQVASYRLIGYNNRRLDAAEFNDDTVDAGEIGAGHTVTALYEVVPAGRAMLTESASSVDVLRYQNVPRNDLPPEHAHEMLTVKVRAQPPGGGKSELYEFPLIDGGRGFDGASADFKFAAAVAGFGLQLRQLPAAELFSFAQVAEWARAGTVIDPGGYRSEFLELVRQAELLSAR